MQSEVGWNLDEFGNSLNELAVVECGAVIVGEPTKTSSSGSKKAAENTCALGAILTLVCSAGTVDLSRRADTRLFPSSPGAAAWSTQAPQGYCPGVGTTTEPPDCSQCSNTRELPLLHNEQTNMRTFCEHARKRVFSSCKRKKRNESSNSIQVLTSQHGVASQQTN